jgi:hypothetical protein
MEMRPEWPVLRDEAIAIVRGAQRENVTLRVVGGAGIRLHCSEPSAALDRLGRTAKDIDFVVPKQDRKGMRRFLEARGYIADRQLLVSMEGRRYSFRHPDTSVDLDVFVERLEFNHTIEVSGRLAEHETTLPVEELLLSKLQIVQLMPNDVIDTAVLLSTHEVALSGGTAEDISAERIALVMAKDWGFHHTVVRNLRQVRSKIGSTVDLGAALNAAVLSRIDALTGAIDAAPKSLSWRIRAGVGERVQWWQDVDDREDSY